MGLVQDLIRHREGAEREYGEHATLRNLYRDLLKLRRETPSLRNLDLGAVETQADDEKRVLLVRRGSVLIAFNFSEEEQTVDVPSGKASWRPLLETGAKLDGTRLRMTPSAFGVFAG